MFKVKVLNQAVLEEVLEMPMVIEAIEQVYTLKEQNQTALFPMVFHEFNPGVADMDIKSGHLKGADIFGLKLVSWFGENKDKNLPLLIGTTMIFDSKTGAPQAILNADHITGMRTGAAGAIGAKYLAKKDSKTMLMVGTGHIAQFEIAATLIAVPSIEKVLIHDPMSVERSKDYAGSIKEKLLKNFNVDKEVTFEAVENFEQAVGVSDVIITATPSRQAMIQKDWVKPGTHLSCVGADMEGKQEIDEKLFADAIVVVDDIGQAVNVGETETAFKAGIISEDKIYSEIGAVILGDKKGRTSDEDITIFDSTGIALQDLMTSKIALELADKKGLGTVIDL
ncbi:ornithine cyclodeaminase family protein [Acidaminobacter sp. JC074]|uniref:ornithine cyclodeaminase family protein n=1 Tax=Acidaminobacter sp. JC074 TaxID=2530199 RepID=UPI001F0E9156|nr:ornithine cyclodeaminase family protein [Acidaminobacter sp. JC074]MCH4886972.1 ornithine cyclodeaminase family protein [Acidaminobacter sp. JC074]